MHPVRIHRASLAALTTVLLAAGADTAHASAESTALRPGIDRPIRVGMFKGTAPGRFWHTNMHTAQSVMGGILANPAGAALGDSLVIPPAGFSFYAMPVALNNAGTGECTGNGCGPTPTQLDTTIALLDTLDGLIINFSADLGGLISSQEHRQALESFWETKGFVSVHATADTYGTWPQLDSVNGTRFRGIPAEQTGQIEADTVFRHEPAWQFLNCGLFSNGIDTTFFEEWFYFTTSGADIRARTNLKPTMILNESSIANPGSQTPMGDHPMSWYRTFPTGGRTFYTALGHRSQVWQNTRTFRRQLYNAVLWTAKYDSVSTVSLQPADTRRSATPDYRLTTASGSLTLEFPAGTARSVSLATLNGRRITQRSLGESDAALRFDGLRSGAYVLMVEGNAGRVTRMVVVK